MRITMRITMRIREIVIKIFIIESRPDQRKAEINQRPGIVIFY
jgi:hypothetical protein